ncbi:hypothetical protein C8R43DRAFT_950868 [Mycena crocata]|nr:hypothetical protein C8R43DRAFT_950868 [Mycena crocata]
MTTPSRDTCSHVAAVEAALQISLAVLASDVVDYVIIPGFPEYVHTQVLRASVSISIMVIGVNSSALRALAAFRHPSPLLHPARPDPFHVEREGGDVDEYAGDELEFRWTWTRILSHREEENLGMWAARVKVMAGTQHLLPFAPTTLPITPPHYHPYSHSLPIDSHVWAPPASPLCTRPSRILLATDASPRGALHEASAVCTNIMHVAQALERCSNTERHLSRKKRPRLPRVSVGRPAAASAVTAVSDNIPCRAATVHPPRPSAPSSLNLVGLLSDIGTAPPPSPPSHLVSRVSPPSPLCPTYVDTGTEPQSAPLLCEVAVDATSVRSFSDVSIATINTDNDHTTTYSEIHNPFVWSLARLVPRNLEWEQRFTQAIYLDDWYCWAEWFDSKDLPPLQRIYLNTLAEMFRPWCDPDHHNSVALYLNPIYNLFTHWWSGYNALTFPTRPPERDPHFCYSWLSDHKLHGQVPLTGRGFVVRHVTRILDHKYLWTKIPNTDPRVPASFSMILGKVIGVQFCTEIAASTHKFTIFYDKIQTQILGKPVTMST